MQQGSRYAKTVVVNVAPRVVNETSPHGSVFQTTFNVQDNAGNNAANISHTVTIRDTTAHMLWACAGSM